MKKYLANLKTAIVSAFGVPEPSDDRLQVKTVAELTTAISDNEHFSWYLGMRVYIGEFNKEYAWIDSVSATTYSITNGILSPAITYPSFADPVLRNLTFNFYPLFVHSHNHDSEYTKTSTLTTLLAAKASVSHTHSLNDILLLASTYATISFVNSGLSDKADISHSHVISDITGLSTSLSEKLSIADLYGNLLPNSSKIDFGKVTGTIYAKQNAASSTGAFALEINDNTEIGTRSFIWHNHSSTPTYSGTNVAVVRTVGAYELNQLNLIELIYFGKNSSSFEVVVIYHKNNTVLFSTVDNRFSYTPATGVFYSKKDPISISGPSMTFDVSNSFNVYTILTANSTISLRNLQDGDSGTILVTQDASGHWKLFVRDVDNLFIQKSHGVTPANAIELPISTGANSIDIIKFIRIGSVIYWTLELNL